MSIAELQVGGDVAPGFEAVLELFTQQAADAAEGGVAYAAYHRGKKVVDLWTGSAAPGVPWSKDTTGLWMSVTKAVTALCVQMLADRGKLDVDERIATYWPEFAAAGKQDITVADVLTHRSGVLGSQGLTDHISLDDGTGIDDEDAIVALLAEASPVWEPGTKTGYHTVTYGWLLGEVIKRTDGRSLGAFFREEVATPLGTEARIGTPPEEHGRIAIIHPTLFPDGMPDVARQYMENVNAGARDPSTPAGISCLARNGVGVLDRIPEVFNNTPGRVAELGGSNMCGTARDVARIFAAMDGGIDGVTLASPESFERHTTIRNDAMDVNLHIEIARALGYWRNKVFGVRPQSYGPNEEAFGHTGVGGQIGFCDPKAHVAAAYVRSHYTAFPLIPLLLNGTLYASVAEVD